MTKIINRWLPPLTLGVWGGILAYFYLSGRLGNFLHPSFRPGVIVAAVILLGMAVWLVASRETGEEAMALACCGDAACAHPLSRNPLGRLLTFAVLLLPFWMSVTTTPNSFSLNTYQNRGVIDDPDALGLGKRKVPSGSQGEVLQLSVIDLLYAAKDRTLMADFDGREVEVTGQTMAETKNNPFGNRLRLVRMFMSCCAADARPIAAVMEFPGQPPSFPELTWLKVRGVVSFPMERGKPLAVVRVSSWEPIEPPRESIMY